MSVELEAKREQMRAVMAERRERRKADPWSNHMSSAPDMELFDEVRRFVDSLAGEELEPSTALSERVSSLVDGERRCTLTVKVRMMRRAAHQCA